MAERNRLRKRPLPGADRPESTRPNDEQMDVGFDDVCLHNVGRNQEQPTRAYGHDLQSVSRRWSSYPPNVLGRDQPGRLCSGCS